VILIVEDDDNTRELYLKLLRHVGIACVATGAPDVALGWARARRFDAVLLDLGLPRIADGIRLASALKAQRDAPPVIAITGHRLEAEGTLFAVTLHKPVGAATIVDTVQRFLAGQMSLDL
jgi:two-component system OmpR family response regulator